MRKTRIETWWASQEDHYPKMSKIALAGLTCFHGPMVEGDFNLMGDVSAKGTTSTTYFHKEDVVKTTISPGLVSCKFRAGKKGNSALTPKRV